MSYEEYFARFYQNHLYSIERARYEFAIRLASAMPSQKVLTELIDIHDDSDEIEYYARLLFDTVKDRGESLDDILFEN